MGQFFSTSYRDITLCSNIDVHCGAIDVVEEPNAQIENRPDASSDRERENSQVDEDISDRNSDQATLNEQIDGTSNDSSHELNDNSKHVNEDITLQESGHLASNEQPDKLPDESSDQVRDNSDDDSIDLGDSSGIESNNRVASTNPDAEERFNPIQSLEPTMKFSDSNGRAQT